MGLDLFLLQCVGDLKKRDRNSVKKPLKRIGVGVLEPITGIAPAKGVDWRPFVGKAEA